MTQRRIYQNIYPYFITSNTQSGLWFFEDEKYARLLYKIIIKACQIKLFDLYAFCILPNHFHLLAKQKSGATADPPDCLAATRRAGGCAVKYWEYVDTPTAQASPPALNKKLPALNKKLPVLNKKEYNISDLLHTIKSYFAEEIRDKYKINYKIWQTRYNFRIIDNPERFLNTLYYIQENYRKKDLPQKYSRAPYQYLNWSQIKLML